jgi:hypothetical protein
MQEREGMATIASSMEREKSRHCNAGEMEMLLPTEQVISNP